MSTQLENNATCADCLAGRTRGRSAKILFSGWTMKAQWSGFCLRQMQSEKVEHLCNRLQLPRLDLQSYQAGVYSRCNTWSLLSPLWQRTGLDHWRWWGGLRDGHIRGLPQQIRRFETYTSIELNNKSTSHYQTNPFFMNRNRCLAKVTVKVDLYFGATPQATLWLMSVSSKTKCWGYGGSRSTMRKMKKDSSAAFPWQTSGEEIFTAI